MCSRRLYFPLLRSSFFFINRWKLHIFFFQFVFLFIIIELNPNIMLITNFDWKAMKGLGAQQKWYCWGAKLSINLYARRCSIDWELQIKQYYFKCYALRHIRTGIQYLNAYAIHSIRNYKAFHHHQPTTAVFTFSSLSWNLKPIENQWAWMETIFSARICLSAHGIFTCEPEHWVTFTFSTSSLSTSPMRIHHISITVQTFNFEYIYIFSLRSSICINQ